MAGWVTIGRPPCAPRLAGSLTWLRRRGGGTKGTSFTGDPGYSSHAIPLELADPGEARAWWPHSAQLAVACQWRSVAPPAPTPARPAPAPTRGGSRRGGRRGGGRCRARSCCPPRPRRPGTGTAVMDVRGRPAAPGHLAEAAVALQHLVRPGLLRLLPDLEEVLRHPGQALAVGELLALDPAHR